MHLLPHERLDSARVKRASSPGHLLCCKYPYPPLSLTQARGLPHNVASAGGRVAQLGEHLLCKQGVGGSNPSTSTNYPVGSCREGQKTILRLGSLLSPLVPPSRELSRFSSPAQAMCALDNGGAPECLPSTSIGSINVRVPRRSCRLALFCTCLSHSWEWPLQ